VIFLNRRLSQVSLVSATATNAAGVPEHKFQASAPGI